MLPKPNRNKIQSEVIKPREKVTPPKRESFASGIKRTVKEINEQQFVDHGMNMG